ncbi:hypothetical protein [Chryseobacterium mulctrae]|uniref:hypothetical protein n=1 Tax=Chryseobacterium mulctrae TaxID=2576777 RepID=UPI0011161115|nr:hypothetical protein [Chryseobacterium mulctrae]
MKKATIIIIGIFATAILLSLEFYIGYEMGYQHHKDEANGRAKEMILNDEIPNYYMVVGTLDFIINNKSGELEETLKK